MIKFKREKGGQGVMKKNQSFLTLLTAVLLISSLGGKTVYATTEEPVSEDPTGEVTETTEPTEEVTETAEPTEEVTETTETESEVTDSADPIEEITETEELNVGEETVIEEVTEEAEAEETVISTLKDSEENFEELANEKLAATDELIDIDGVVVTGIDELIEAEFLNEETGETESFLFYFDANGNYVKNAEIEYPAKSGVFYYFDEKGHALRDAWNANETKYYKADGTRASGTLKIEEYYYNFDPKNNDIKITSRFVDINPTYRVYYDAAGHLMKGSARINGEYYYFDMSSGRMAVNKFIDINPTYRVYYDENGHIVKGTRKIGSYWYNFNTSNGGMIRDQFVQIKEGYKVYYQSNGHLAIGRVQAKNGHWYYFASNGNMITGWVWFEDLGYSVHYDTKTGELAVGTVKIDGYTHTFASNGKGQPTIEWVLHKYSWRPVRLVVNLTTSTLTVYTRDNEGNYTIPVKAFVVTTGRKSKSAFTTPQGASFYVGSKKRWYYNDRFTPVLWNQYCTFWTGTGSKTSIMFHSLAYDVPNINNPLSANNYTLRVSQWGKIGKQSSSGCIRMYARDCKWIYDKVPAGSRIMCGTTDFLKKNISTKIDPLGKPARLSQYDSIVSAKHWDATDTTSLVWTKYY